MNENRLNNHFASIMLKPKSTCALYCVAYLWIFVQILTRQWLGSKLSNSSTVHCLRKHAYIVLSYQNVQDVIHQNSYPAPITDLLGLFRQFWSISYGRYLKRSIICTKLHFQVDMVPDPRAICNPFWLKYPQNSNSITRHSSPHSIPIYTLNIVRFRTKQSFASLLASLLSILTTKSHVSLPILIQKIFISKYRL